VVVCIVPSIMFTRQVVRAAQKMNFAAIRPTRGGPWIEVIRPNVERTKYPFGLLMSGEETLRRLQEFDRM
jgi:hypothetical protein